MDLVAEQLREEERQDAQAEADAIREYMELLREGNIDKLPKAKLLLGNVFPVVQASIEAEQKRIGRGPRAHLRGWLRRVPSDAAAVLAIRTTMRIILSTEGRLGQGYATLQRIAVAIARDWVQEILVRDAERVNPAYYQATVKGLDRGNVTDRRCIQMAMSKVVKNTLAALGECNLSTTELLHLGKWGLQACMDAGLVGLDRSTSTQGNLVEYRLTPEVLAFLQDTRQVAAMVGKASAPMLVPPQPWEGLVGGGFLTPRRQLRNPLVNYRKLVRRSQVKAFLDATQPEQMPAVYRYANYVQATPFRVNTEVLGHVLRVWQAGGGALGLPSQTPPPKPEFPFAETWSKVTATPEELEAFGRWKRETTRWHEAIRKHKSTLWEIRNFVKHASEYAERDVYFPVFLDGRGRLYYRCTPNPQGSDAAKAVLQFAERRPLGERGVYWLKVHIANCFGVDRVKFDERAAWTTENWHRLEAACDAPEESGVFETADSPVCALAGCLELRKALRSGDPASYLCGLPVHMDATCSGLQHFSAMLLDTEGGQWVNLLPGGTEKADIYRRVATLAEGTIREEAARGEPLAQAWADLGISRNLAKSPVMTYVYGATLLSVRAGIERHLAEDGWTHPELDIRDMAMYLAKHLFKAIEQAVPAAAAAMRWLRQLMRHVPREQPVQWVTPLGFTVNHDYRDEERTRVRVRSCGLEYVVMYNRLDNCKLSRMQNAIAPNFVHSMDATHLGMTALRMQDAGLQMVCIHDSFGTHPSDVDTMHRCIRSAFVHLYSRDVLRGLAEQLGANVTYLERGSLELGGVEESEFFFC